MNPTLYFSVCSLAYCILFLVTLYTRKEKQDAENKILKILGFINLGNLLCEVIGIFLGNNYEKFELLNDIALRLMLVFYISWFTFFVIFVLNIAKKEKKFTFKKNLLIYLLMGVCIILSIFLPITYNTNDLGVIIYSTGPAVQVIYYYIIFSNMACLFIMFKNVKKIKIVNYSSLFALIVLSTLAAAIQSYWPSILLTSSAETFVLYIAYINIKRNQEQLYTKEMKK